MSNEPKSKLQDGDEIIFKLSRTGWSAHVKHATGGISGRVVPFKTFDDALAAIKEDNQV